MTKLTRRDFLKLSGMTLGGMVFSPLASGWNAFEDAQFVRVATHDVAVYQEPNDKSKVMEYITRDALVHVYKEVKGQEVDNNTIWYRVWGGYMHRARLQRVKFLLNKPMDFIPEGTRQLMEVTVPMANPWLLTKSRGWEKMMPPIYYESVHWVDGIQEGPDGNLWYRIWDELDSNVDYFLPAATMRPIPHNELEPISPDVPWDKKRIDVNLTTQTLTAFEYDKPVFQTKISSGVAGKDTMTPRGKFQVIDKMPSKHMGNSFFGVSTKGNLLADAEGYVLPGVPWTSFFTGVGHAFHGTYWHENYGAPMSHGCINMRTPEARWIFRWALPPHTTQALATEYSFHYGNKGTAVNIFF